MILMRLNDKLLRDDSIILVFNISTSKVENLRFYRCYGRLYNNYVIFVQ
jgi:hypothetical protein